MFWVIEDILADSGRCYTSPSPPKASRGLPIPPYRCRCKSNLCLRGWSLTSAICGSLAALLDSRPDCRHHRWEQQLPYAPEQSVKPWNIASPFSSPYFLSSSPSHFPCQTSDLCAMRDDPSCRGGLQMVNAVWDGMINNKRKAPEKRPARLRLRQQI